MVILRCLLTVICVIAASTEGAKIIMLAPFESNSHRTVFIHLAQGLVSKGHKVTIVGMYKPKPGDLHDGITEITIPGVHEEYQRVSDRFFNLTKQGQPAYMSALVQFNNYAADSFLDSEIVKKLYQQPNAYDIAIVHGLVSEYSYGLAHKIAPIIVLLSPTYLVPWVADALQVPRPPSYIPSPTLPYTTNMTFTERFWNAYMFSFSTVQFRSFVNPSLDEKVQSRFPGLPTIREIERNISLALVNAEPGLSAVLPEMPNVINIGGMHCRPAKPLTGDIAKYLETIGEEGFIFFSLGTVLKSSILPQEIISTFINAFKNLKQKVIWKYEKELTGLPDNVKIFKWLPQQDILGHDKLRLFITHSGLLSLQEAVYHGVPLITIPVFADQPGNSARIVELGLGEELNIHALSEKHVVDTILKVINDKSYKLKVLKRSAITRDQTQHPVDRGVFWIEYVLRHNGAPHLRSSADDLNFFQFFLLDVVSVLAASIIIIAFGIMKIFQLIFTKMFKRSNKNKAD